MGAIDKVFRKSFAIYGETFELTIFFSIFVFLSLILLPLLSSYVASGAGFVRFSSLYTSDISIIQLIIFCLVGFVSLLCLSIFLSAQICVTKLKETLDHARFNRVVNTFPKYVLKILTFLLLMTVLSLVIGTTLSLVSVPNPIIQLVILCMWLPLIFAPQILVLEDLGLGAALVDSIEFISRSPLSLVAYIALGFVMLLVLSLVEAILGNFMFWEHKLLGVVITSLFILPFLQIFATELYIVRYPVAKV
jgi:hypothetical protein